MTKKSHRYNLVLPVEMANQLSNTAERRGESVTGLLKRFIRLGLLLMNNPNCKLIVIDGGDEKEVLIV
jgi:hypothetical protein